MTIGVDEDRRVATPEGLGGLAADGRPRLARLLDHGVDLFRGTRVVGGRHAAPAATVLHARVLGELGAVPERDDHPARLEEDHVVAGFRSRSPPERLIERACPLEIGYAERDEAQALVHQRCLTPSWTKFASTGPRTATSPSASSIASSVSSESSTPEAAAFECTCSGREAPTMAEATLSSRSTQASAIWTSVRPAWSAIATSRCTASRTSSDM